jgi:protein dithiol:quinone oxidoreductase
MKKNLLYLIGALCVAMLGFAVHLQYFSGIKACQLCVLQRYALVLLAIVCFICAFFNAPRTGAISGLLISLSGAGTAGWQVWHASRPSVSCGISSLESLLNNLITAKFFPTLFRVEGACVDDKFRLFTFSIPEWSLFAFGGFTIVCVLILFFRRK